MPQIGGVRARWRRALARSIPLMALGLVATLFLHGWWNGDLPATPRLELTPELGHIWQWQWRLREGEGLAAWNHLALTGTPLLTSRSWPFYAGLAWFSLATGLSPAVLFKLNHLAMAILGGWGMMALLRRLGVRWRGALVAGWTYVLYPMRVFVTVEAMTMVMNWAGLAWSFWASEGLRAAGSRGQAVRRGALWGAILAWMALTSLQLFLMELWFLAVYVGLRELFALAGRKGGPLLSSRPPLLPESGSKGGGQPWLGLLAAGVAATGLTCYLFLPAAVEQNLLGLRGYLEAWPQETVLPAPPPLMAWVMGARFAPDFDPLSVRRYMMQAEFSFYLGWVALLLALAGLVVCRRRAVAWCLAGLLVFSFLLSVGPGVPYNPVYWLVRRTPVLADAVRYSHRALLGVSLGLAGLAGLGADGLLGNLAKPAPRWGLAVALGLLVVADFWPGSLAYRSVEQYLHPDEVEVHRWLDAQKEATRYWVPIQVEPYGWHYVRSTAGWQYNRRPILTEDNLQPATSPWHSLRVLNRAIRQEIEPEEDVLSPVGQAALSLAGARYGLVHRNAPVYEEVVQRLIQARGWRVLRLAEHVYLLENPGARPYLQAYRRGAMVEGGDEAFQVEWLPGCLERGYALVERTEGREGTEGVMVAVGGDGCGSLPAVGEAEVRLAGGPPRRDAIRVDAEAGEPFVLMVAESWYPHWGVEVDGGRAELLRVNGGFLGAAVPGGAHEVVFRFRVPWYQKVGLSVSGMTALALLLAGGASWVRRRR